MFRFYFARYKEIAAAAAIIVLVTTGFLVWNLRPKVMIPSGDLTIPLATTSPDQIPDAGSQPRMQSPQTNFPAYRGQPPDILNPDSKFLAQVPQAAYQKSLQELANLAGRIKQNPGDSESWLRVAHIRHFYGDEIGARDAYEYMNLVFEGDPLPFYNLALLYGYYLKEPAKAIPKYRSAIERNPAEASYYIGFADFYREVLGDLKSAEAVLLEGEKKIQGSINIFIALGALYKTKDDKTKAIEYYEKALDFPSFQGQERNAVLSEVERLKKIEIR